MAEHVAQLAGELGDAGWDATIAGPSEAAFHAAADANGISVHRLPLVRSYARPHKDAVALLALVRLLRRERFDLVHGHASKAGVLARIAAAVCRVPVVYSPHCFAFVGDVSAARRVFATVVERVLAPLTTRTICVCEDERVQALRAGAGRPEQLRVVLNASDPCPDVEPDPDLARMAADGPLAGVVAALRPQKTVDVFVDAAPDVLRRLPSARLAVVGDGPERPAIEARARALGLDADPRFALLPFRAPAARHLRALDVYVLPSAWEALPIGVLEALACGVPQVATDVGGTAEAVRPSTGVLVPPHDPAALADALVDLLGDRDRRRAMSSASVQRHRAQFSIDRMISETVQVYAEAVTARGARTAAVRPAAPEAGASRAARGPRRWLRGRPRSSR